MFFQRFTWQIIIRVLVLAGSIAVLAWIWGDTRLLFTQVIVMLLIVTEVAELIRFINFTNRELARFLFAIRHGDLSATFRQRALGPSFRLLQRSMAELADAYKHVRIEKEAQYQLLRMLVDKIAVGIVLLTEGDVALINGTAQRLLDAGGSQDWKLILQRNPVFGRELDSIGENGRKLVELAHREGSRMISTGVSSQLILGKASKLITLQDINTEIEQKEIEAWHKLIRILTHEIMNSITPIASLTETLQGMLTNGHGTRKRIDELNDDVVADMLFSLNTIHVRSEGLLHFVDNYRKLTRVPKPQPAPVDLASFAASIEKLMSETAQRHGVKLVVSGSFTEVMPVFDQSLMQQVLINLISNGIHATEDMPGRSVTVQVGVHDEKVIFEVSDTGKGIPPHLLREIFVPFYSTRKDGSGIGLSLSKQIVSLHNGHISVQSTPGSGTTFTIALPAGTIR